MIFRTYLFALAMLLTGAGMASPAYAEWMTEAAMCNKVQKMPAGCLKGVTSKGFFVTWGGVVTHLEMKKGEFVGNMKVKITWISDGTKYQCGQIMKFNYFNELKDLTALSIAMRKCP